MNSSETQNLYHDSKASAKKAGLIFVDLHKHPAGYKRIKKTKNTFEYIDAKGKIIKDTNVTERIQSLGIPPAWKDVWIATSPKAHIQATGIDKKGAIQYRYHHTWSAFRETLKFDRLAHFAQVLPTLRKEIALHLKDSTLTREKSVAAVLALMDEFSIRIGNESYARDNKTYGLTTLQDRHVDIRNGVINLHFVGKSHKEHEYTLKNTALAHVVQESKDIPGSHLFQYLDEYSKRHPLTSNEVNAFIKEVTQEQFTAKDFRMWSATVHAYTLLKDQCGQTLTPAQAKKSLKEVISCVAEKLGNTPAVCKAHYIHGKLQSSFTEGKLLSLVKNMKKRRKSLHMKAEELELQLLLEKL